MRIFAEKTKWILMTLMKMNNLDWYTKFAPVPAHACREIQAGKLKGKTDINPLWRIKILTEHFGPVGFGWVSKITEHWVERDGNETAVWVRAELSVKNPETGEWSKPIEGVGGAKQYGKGQGDGINDEAYKMAETDAISVCCKKLGIGADIYWQADSTKYSNSSIQDQRSCKQIKTNPVTREKQCIVREILENNSLEPLIVWLVERYDKNTAEIPLDDIKTLHDSYLWDKETTFEDLVNIAMKRAFVNDLQTKE